MKLRKLSKIILLLWTCSLSFAQAKPMPTYRFVTYDFPPYSYFYQNQPRGPGYALIMHICQAMKATCRVDMMPWRDALWETRRGKADGVFFVEGRGDQKLWLHLSDPLTDAHYGMFVPLNLRLHYSQAKDLRVLDWKIGSVKDTHSWYYFNRVLDEKNRHVRGVAVRDFVTALTKLRDGGLNAVYMNKATGYWLSKKNKVFGIRYAGSDRSVPLYFGFSKRQQDPTFVARFNAALQQSKDSGLQRRIFKMHSIG